MTWPLYYIFNTALILGLTRFWYNDRHWSPSRIPYSFLYRRIQRIHYAYRAFLRRNFIASLLSMIVNYLLIMHAAYFIFRPVLHKLVSLNPAVQQCATELKQVLIRFHLFYPDPSLVIKIVIVAFVCLCIREGRKVLIGILKYGTKLGGLWPDEKSIQFYKRYLNIGRFANYETSSAIFGRLEKQYDPGTGFILLPMDMAYMSAGPIKKKGNYLHQMEELAKIKAAKPKTAFPFVFIDPRRISSEPDFLKYKLDPVLGKVALEDSIIKTYIEQGRFNGFKIYPALGYYPFDERLLILWKYAADNRLPIMTHAIRGTIYYRGTKNKEWGYHPVFHQSKGSHHEDSEKLLLPELRNINYINNFTHPLNYLCLVEERALRHVVGNATSQEVKDFFGYKDLVTPLMHNLNHLKLCFGHYGGEDEWKRYLEYDRNQYAPQLTTHPDRGIDFLDHDNFSPVKMEQLWKNADWYSIISSLILQKDNVYADISYIIHDETIFPLLKSSLQNSKLRTKILFGTDFYVVRNHKSEREMLGELEAGLSTDEFDMIARKNPVSYLNSVNFP